MKGCSQGSYTQNPRPDQLLGDDNNSSEQASKTESNQERSERDEDLESPSSLVPVEHLLFSQHVGAETNIDTKVGHDVDQSVFLELLDWCMYFGRIQKPTFVLKGPGFNSKDHDPSGTVQLGMIFSHSFPRG